MFTYVTVSRKAAPIMNALVRTSRVLLRPVKEVTYRTVIYRPVLEYGCMIYDNCQAFISHTLEQSQRTAALACTWSYRDTSHSKLLSESGWPTLAKRREYYKLCQLLKMVHGMSPTYNSIQFNSITLYSPCIFVHVHRCFYNKVSETHK